MLSAGQLLGWYGQKTGQAKFQQAAKAIEDGIAAAIAAGEAAKDVSGRLGTQATGQALVQRLRAA